MAATRRDGRSRTESAAPWSDRATSHSLSEVPFNPVLAFVVVMLVWTISDFVAKKTKSLLSSLFVASIIFLVGFLTDLFPEDLLASSSCWPWPGSSSAS